MKKLFKSLFYLLFLMLLTVIIYFLTVYTFSLFPKKVPKNEVAKNQTIYLLYDDMHSEIILNIQELNRSLFPEFSNKHKGYLAFGWGDKESYLNTPTWNDLSISTSIKALFSNTPTLMHVSYISNLQRFPNLKTIQLSKVEKKHLQTSILKSFDFNKKRYQGYGKEDFFYTAKGSYNLINTCNTWTGDQLREVNISMSYWTPLSANVTATLP
ncbi:MAG: Unknown protein [uncultured Sulfurovum sp.]|uniref:DUF2459 domain-containing protein n=1 Tax=uncultured Sulfurovum sp. TaxID=269237 RepID=A0A6S6TZR5_9BACT|nr:MAG: Unknown protein [uncultured Sulfurovum sp.]